jgi:hydroxyacylglutathione hydrolase
MIKQGGAMTYTITPIPAFNDNYIWLIGHENSRSAIIVDPGCADAVNVFCAQNNWNIKEIWITHHHDDHIGGVPALVEHWHCKTFGPALSDETYDIALQDGDTIDLFDQPGTATIIETPGHTKDHICYMSSLGLFCGDTLFSAGCGRAFECPSSILYNSLNKLAQLPAATKVFCAHEYTANNLSFAASVEPDNLEIQERIKTVNQLRASSAASLPSTIAIELATNPFLRCKEPAVRSWAKAQQSGDLSDAEVFGRLRAAKDNW